MGVTFKKTNNIPRLTKVLESLGKRTINVGVFGADNYKYGNDADLVTIARVHEFGATIKPVRAEWLTIPLIPAAKNKRAADFQDLFFRKSGEDDHAFLSRKKGQGLENVFLLVKSVNIPERAFIRTGFDANVNNIMDKIENLLNGVLDFGINPDVFLDMVGMEFASLIQKHTRGITAPPNSKITTGVKRSSNPLMDTGRLIGSIRHEIE